VKDQQSDSSLSDDAADSDNDNNEKEDESDGWDDSDSDRNPFAKGSDSDDGMLAFLTEFSLNVIRFHFIYWHCWIDLQLSYANFCYS